MKAYRIYEQDVMGYEGNVSYTSNYNKAIRIFNDKVRDEVKKLAGDLINRYEFGEAVQSFRKWHGKHEILSRRYPFIVSKVGRDREAKIYYWERTSYEYSEYEIVSSTIVMSEIEIID